MEEGNQRPKIIIVGNWSSRKSSVLESFTNINLPWESAFALEPLSSCDSKTTHTPIVWSSTSRSTTKLSPPMRTTSPRPLLPPPTRSQSGENQTEHGLFEPAKFAALPQRSAMTQQGDFSITDPMAGSQPNRVTVSEVLKHSLTEVTIPLAETV